MQQTNDVENAWRLFPHTFASVASRQRWKPYTHLIPISEAIAEAVHRGKGRIIVSLPPRHGKSELISKWVPAWFLDLMPWGRVLLASYEADFASHWGRQVRTFFEMAGDLTRTKIKSDSHAADRWETSDGGSMNTAGVGGAFTGKGGDLLLIDDPIKNWEQAMSKGHRDKVRDWFKSTFYTRAEPNATIIVLMTRWHEDDLAGYLLNEHEDDWVEIKLPAISDDGKALCPERYDLTALQSIKKSIGSIMFGSLFQQDPTPPEGGIFKRNHFRFWTPDTLPKSFDEVIQSWDLPFDDENKATASFVSGQVWARKAADRYLLGEFHEQCDFPAMKRAVTKMTDDFPAAITKLVENKAAGAPLIKDMKGTIPGLVAWNPVGSKVARAISVSGVVESGNVYVPHPTVVPWSREFIEECAVFPKGKLKDRVDAMVQALLRFGGARKNTTVGIASLTRVSPLGGLG